MNRVNSRVEEWSGEPEKRVLQKREERGESGILKFHSELDKNINVHRNILMYFDVMKYI